MILPSGMNGQSSEITVHNQHCLTEFVEKGESTVQYVHKLYNDALQMVAMEIDIADSQMPVKHSVSTVSKNTFILFWKISIDGA